MSSSIKSLLTGTLVALSIGVVGAADAMAATVTATLTADNHYGLLYGNEDGSELNLVGRNEYGRGGNPGLYNWSLPETWNFDVSSQDYIYVVTWDDGGVDASWIGEFTFDNGEKLLSKAGSWEYILSSGPRPGLPGEVPDNAELFDEISNANWVNAQSRGPNGTSPCLRRAQTALLRRHCFFMQLICPERGGGPIERSLRSMRYSPPFAQRCER